MPSMALHEVGCRSPWVNLSSPYIAQVGEVGFGAARSTALSCKLNRHDTRYISIPRSIERWLHKNRASRLARALFAHMKNGMNQNRAFWKANSLSVEQFWRRKQHRIVNCSRRKFNYFFMNSELFAWAVWEATTNSFNLPINSPIVKKENKKWKAEPVKSCHVAVVAYSRRN